MKLQYSDKELPTSTPAWPLQILHGQSWDGSLGEKLASNSPRVYSSGTQYACNTETKFDKYSRNFADYKLYNPAALKRCPCSFFNPGPRYEDIGEVEV